jgi:hypothetical protein
MAVSVKSNSDAVLSVDIYRLPVLCMLPVSYCFVVTSHLELGPRLYVNETV